MANQMTSFDVMWRNNPQNGVEIERKEILKNEVHLIILICFPLLRTQTCPYFAKSANTKVSLPKKKDTLNMLKP